MSIISKKLQILQPSATMAIANRASELQSAGISVISLALGEPDSDTPLHVKEAAIQAINNNFTKYTSVDGIKELKLAIQQKFKQENQLDYALNELTVGNGAKQVIFNLLAATLDPGDEVIIAAPYWVSYVESVLFNDAHPIVIHTKVEHQFKLLPEELDQAITAKTKWLILNSPSNPTGMVYSKEELVSLAEVLYQHPRVHILSDDIYEHLIFGPATFHNIAAVAPELKERSFIVNGVSKAYSMTGWRIGYGAGKAEIIRAIAILQSQTTSNPCSISQKAALAALSQPAKDYFAFNLKQLLLKRDLVMEALQGVSELELHQPQGGFYFFISCANAVGKITPLGMAINDGDDFASYLLENGVAVTPGSAFGSLNYFRLSYAVSLELLREACVRIKQCCAQLVGH